jgi:hypothetical protein
MLQPFWDIVWDTIAPSINVRAKKKPCFQGFF